MKALIFFVIVFNCSSLFGQQPSDRIRPGTINFAYLEHLTKIGIDSVRMAHGLAPLRNDSILYVAAKEHAHYLDSTNTVGHFENGIPGKYAPQDRVNSHGGVDYSVGENALVDYVFTPENDPHDPSGTPTHENDTYGEMAHSMVMCWVHSPPHYKNMLTPGYEFTGLAVAFDPKDSCFHAVQVFGILPYYKPGQGANSLFPYEPDLPTVVTDFSQVSHEPHSDVHAYELRAPEDSAKTCTSCWDENFSTATTKIEVVNGNIVFTTKDVNLIKSLIDNRTDGLAAEIVGYKPYDCSNPQYYLKPSRRNRQCIFSGRILKPVYRKKLKRGFKKKHKHGFGERFRNASSEGHLAKNKRAKRKAWHDEFEFPFDAETYTVSLGKYPKDLDGQYYEINVVIIQKKQVCRVIHFTSFCGDDWSLAPDFDEPLTLSPDTLAFQSKFKSYSFQVPFEQGKAEYKQKDIQPFLDSLQLTHFKILGATINAFASVEGSETINQSLQNGRAASIAGAMRMIVADSFPTTSSAFENWELFDTQVKTVPEFSCFKGKTHAEVKSMLADTVLARKLEPWLSKERYGSITLQLEIFISPSSSCDWLSGKLNAWSDSLIKTKNRNYLDSLDRLQHYYFTTARIGKVDTACLEKFRWPANAVFDTLSYNHAWLMRDLYHANLASADKLFYGSCVSRVNGNLNAPYLPCVLGMVNEYMRYWNGSQMIDNSDPETILKWIRWLEQSSSDSIAAIADSLELSWYYKSVPYYEAKGKKYDGKVDASLSYIIQYWNSGRMNDSIALRLTNDLIFHNHVDWAIGVLQPYALLPTPNHKVLMKYIQLTYSHIEEDTAFSDYASFITWASTYLTHDEWCSMFVGPCNISFQLFDAEKMRDLYCEECAGWKNYARDPEKWKVGQK